MVFYIAVVRVARADVVDENAIEFVVGETDPLHVLYRR